VQSGLRALNTNDWKGTFGGYRLISTMISRLKSIQRRNFLKNVLTKSATLLFVKAGLIARHREVRHTYSPNKRNREAHLLGISKIWALKLIR